MQCHMIGCKKEVFNSFTLGPGTYIPLCKTHYEEEMYAKYGENKFPDEGSTSGMDKLDEHLF